jgi:hypothetical protein
MVNAKRIAALLLVLAAGSTVQAELTEGEKELGLAAYWSDTDEVGSEIFVDLLLGFMLTENHEVGPIVNYLASDPDEDDSQLDDLLDNDAGLGGAFYRYNFSGGGAIPFIGADVAFPFGDLSDSVDYAAGVDLGVRIMPGERASVNFQAFYDRLFAEDPFDDFDRWGISAGVSVFFGGP